MKTYLSILILAISLSLSAQSSYEEAIQMGDRAFMEARYADALQKYRAAQAFEPAKQSIVDSKIYLIFEAIGNQKREAEEARIQAAESERLARRSLAAMEKAKEESEQQRRIAEEARRAAFLANAKLKKIMGDAFHFYDNKVALVPQQKDRSLDRYCLIDTSGNLIVDYRYSEVSPFKAETALAKVKYRDSYYLLDTLGNEYLLAESLGELTDSTEALDLSNKDLISFPSEILWYRNLKILLINGNQISSIPDSLSNLVLLQWLDMSSNQLEELPNDLTSLKRLTFLDVSQNKLSGTDFDIGLFDDLQYLSLANNQLGLLPESIGQLPNLQLLDLSNNKLTGEIPNFEKLGNLKSISLNGNSLSLQGDLPGVPESLKQAIARQHLVRKKGGPDGNGSAQSEHAYQDWLDQTGLGAYLKVQEVGIENDRTNLYLAIPFERVDSVAAVWRKLQETYFARTFQSLPEALFENMLRIFGLSAESSTVQLYDTYDLTRPVLFFTGIYADEEQIKIDSSNVKGLPINLGNLKIEIESFATTEAIYALDRPSTFISYLEQFMEAYIGAANCFNPTWHLVTGKGKTSLYKISPECLSSFLDSHPDYCTALERVGANCSADPIPLELCLLVSLDEESMSIRVEAFGKRAGENYDWLGTEFSVFSRQFTQRFIQDFNEFLLQEKTKGKSFAKSEVKKTKVIYVKEGAQGNGTSWDNALGNLQNALGIAKKGDQIWVARGTYYPTNGNGRNVSFVIPDGVQVYGGFVGTEEDISQRDLNKNKSILSGEIGTPSSDDNSFSVVYTEGVGNTTIVDGVTITGGVANGFTVNGDLTFSGAGWFNDASRNDSSPTIRNCTFVNNYAREGGAFYNYGNGHATNPSISHCSFLGNKADFDGGGIFNFALNSSCRPKIARCNFENNRATYGAAILNKAVNGKLVTTITNSVFASNSSILEGVIYNSIEGRGQSESKITGSQFMDNNAKEIQTTNTLKGQGGQVLRSN